MTIFNSAPFNLQNGNTADATQVMANFNQTINDGNTNAAHNGANSDITSLSGLSTPLNYAQGGTGTTTSTPLIPWAVAAGSADAITATYSPANGSLFDGLILGFRAKAANATTTPTFSPDSLTAHVITKYGGTALVAGDIPAALAEIMVRYNLANTRWELIDPVAGISSISDATNGGLNFSSPTGVVTAKMQPSDLLTKSAPTSSDSIVIMDAAAGNAAKTSTGAQATAMLSNFVGDSGSGGTAGTVPAPPSGSAAAGKVLGAGGSFVLAKGSFTAGTPLVMNPYATTTTQTQAHGLGVTPTFTTWKLECLSAELNWSVGDVITGHTLNGADAITDSGFVIAVNATNVIAVTESAGTIYILDKTNHNLNLITAAKWKLTVTPYLIN